MTATADLLYLPVLPTPENPLTVGKFCCLLQSLETLTGVHASFPAARPPVAFPETSRRDQSGHVNSRLKGFAVRFKSVSLQLHSGHIHKHGLRWDLTPPRGCSSNIQAFPTALLWASEIKTFYLKYEPLSGLFI